MKITLEADSKEVADLVLRIQGRQPQGQQMDSKQIAEAIIGSFDEFTRIYSKLQVQL